MEAGYLMREVFDSLIDYFLGNWPELIWIVVVAGLASYLAGRRSRQLWHKREFLDRLNVSLTSIRDGRLKIRTILETDVNDIFLNQSASRKIVTLSKKTTESDPLIPIPDDDLWYYLNAVLNEISERFAIGHLRQDAKLSTNVERYVICLTCERAGAVRTQKIRAMLVRKQLLESLPKEEPEYESPSHVTRWHTLQVMAQRWQENPEQFLSIEICI